MRASRHMAAWNEDFLYSLLTQGRIQSIALHPGPFVLDSSYKIG